MSDNQKSNIQFGTEIAISIITLGIVPLVKTLNEVWKSGAEEREQRRLFRLERKRIKNMKKGVTK